MWIIISKAAERLDSDRGAVQSWSWFRLPTSKKKIIDALDLYLIDYPSASMPWHRYNEQI